MNHSASRRRSGFSRADLIVTLAALALAIPACGDRVMPAREAAARSQSQNNLKQMCIGIHQMVSPTDSPMPPAVGMYPSGGPWGTIFFHILPGIEQDNVYQHYKVAAPADNANPMGKENVSGWDAIAANVTIKTYCAPADPTNPGVNTALTSYAANAWLFGSNEGTTANPRSGIMRLSQLVNGKGTANSIFFMERFAVTAASSGHLWPDGRFSTNALGIETAPYVYLANFGAPATILPNGESPVFGVASTAITNNGTNNNTPNDGTAHSFNSQAIIVGLADGSAKTVSTGVNTVNAVTTVPAAIPAYTTWRWAVSATGATAQAPVPPTW